MPDQGSKLFIPRAPQTLGGSLDPKIEGSAIEKYPMAALGGAAPTGVPILLRLEWPGAWDRPVWDWGRHRVGTGGDPGYTRGGHIITVKPYGVEDPEEFWRFYDQGPDGACGGFTGSRVMSLLNRVQRGGLPYYDGFWLYNAARDVDPWPPGNFGTNIASVCKVLRDKGPARKRDDETRPPNRKDGISAYRWMKSWSEMKRVAGYPDSEDGVDLVNSWGEGGWPHVVRLDDTTGDWVFRNLSWTVAAAPTDR